MPLIRCRDCGNSVSDRAPTCPKCGAPTGIVYTAPPTLRRKGIGLFSGCLLTIAGIVVVGVISAFVLGSNPAVRERVQRRASVRDQVTLDKWSYTKLVSGTIMHANFTISNRSSKDVKDLTIKIVHFGASGTEIDSNTRTIYDIIKAGETREFKDFDMGFVHTQATDSKAYIEDLVIIE